MVKALLELPVKTSDIRSKDLILAHTSSCGSQTESEKYLLHAQKPNNVKREIGTHELDLFPLQKSSSNDVIFARIFQDLGLNFCAQVATNREPH